MNPTRALSLKAFFTLLLIALMMSGNHIAARLAFNSGMDVATGVASRSGVTALVLGVIIWWAKVPWRINRQQARALFFIGLNIGVQSQMLYAAVARLPVALALLAFNTYPLWATLWDRVIYKRRPERAVLLAMPIILLGLALALDVLGAASGLGARAQWALMGEGVAFAVAGAASFGLVLVWTQHETAGLDGRLRTGITVFLAGSVALATMAWHGGPHWPQTPTGWGGLVMLTLLYGTAFTIMFTVLPKLGAAGNSAIMNVEPVFALLLGWGVLGQTIAPVQMLGALLVVAVVVKLGLRKAA